MAEKYWENEDPSVMELGKNQLRYYEKAGKLQVYPLAPNTPHGVGRGATLDLTSMSVDELDSLKGFITRAIDDQLTDEME